MIINDYKDFLRDMDFIYWRLTKDYIYNTYWDDYIIDHPELKDEFEKAIHEVDKIKLDNEKLTDDEYNSLLSRIHITASKEKNRKLYFRFAGIAAAACLALLFIFSIPYLSKNGESSSLPVNNIIVGENLEEKDIYLITESETTSFSQDVIVKIDKSGSAVVQEVNGEKKATIDAGKSEMNKLVIPYGKRSQLELSDGSKVWLNSGSVLEFPSTFSGKNREISLSGEMYIEVEKDEDKPFFVNIQGFQVKVYGTSFNITSYKDMKTQSVVLIEGSVSIIVAASKDEMFMMPDEMILLRDNTHEKIKVDVTKYISWKDGYLQMDKTPIDEVLKQIERYYNLSFSIGENLNLSSKTCSGKIYLSQNLDNVMETISLLTSTHYTRDDNKIYINVNP